MLIDKKEYLKEVNEYLINVYGCTIDEIEEFQRGSDSKETYILQGFFEAMELLDNIPIADTISSLKELVKKREVKFVSCNKCKHMVLYKELDTKEVQMHMNEYKKFVVCEECGNEIIL